jgi:hypothetical protein
MKMMGIKTPTAPLQLTPQRTAEQAVTIKGDFNMIWNTDQVRMNNFTFTFSESVCCFDGR